MTTRTAYIVYSAQVPQGSWKWQRPTEVYVLYGPITELVRVKTRNSVGSKRCPNVKEKYIGWGDGRYSGPNSAYGRALLKAHEWAESQGFVCAYPAIDAWKQMKKRRPKDARRWRGMPSVAKAQCRQQLIAIGVHERHAHLITKDWPYVRPYTADEAAAKARPVLALYRLGIRVTSDSLKEIRDTWQYVQPNDRLLAHRPDLAVRVRLEQAQNIRHPKCWLQEVA